MQNPLIQTILSLLHRNPAGISEHLILKSLADHAGFSEIGDAGQLALFQKHFMVMNALYQLQQQLWDEAQLILEISPLRVQLYPSSTREKTEHLAPAENPALGAYYLDWENFQNTTETNVLELLDSFWRRFIQADERVAALRELGLEAEATPVEITRRYRELVTRHHPDKGGEQAIFIRIRQAYELLGNR